MSNLIPNGWSISTLSDLALIDRQSLKGNTESDYRFKYIDIASVKTARIDVPSNYMTFEGSPSRARKIVQKGDILMSTVRPNLKSFAYFDKEGDDFVASTGFAVITAKKTSDGRFLYQSILSDDVSRQIESLVAGSNYPAISSANVKCLEVLAPPLPEQQKIATILSSVDDVIEKIRAQIDKLKDLKTGMMQELLTKGIGHTEFKDSPVGRIPVGWNTKLCSDVCVKITDGEHLSPKYVENGYPILSAKDLEDYGIDFSNAKLVGAKDFEKMLRKCNPEYGDVLIVSRGATIGKTTLNISDAKYALMGSVILLKPNKLCLGEFLSLYIALPQVQQNMLQLSGSSAQQAIYLRDIKEMPIPVPPLQEQKVIADSIGSVDIRIQTVVRRYLALQRCKKALMQDLLTGKVRVNITDKESAVS